MTIRFEIHPTPAGNHTAYIRDDTQDPALEFRSFMAGPFAEHADAEKVLWQHVQTMADFLAMQPAVPGRLEVPYLQASYDTDGQVKFEPQTIARFFK